MTLIEKIGQRGVEATELYFKRQSEVDRHIIDMASYRNGEAVAYIDAQRMIKEEMRRLCNLFQNGQLSVEDFGVVL